VVRLNRREVEASVETLQPLPQTVSQLMEIVESETATIEQMESLINADPVLCGKILQVANSAYYGLARQVSSIRGALMLLGVHAIRGIAISVAMVSALRVGRVVCEAEQRLWRHAFVCMGLPKPRDGDCVWRKTLTSRACCTTSARSCC
jgi:HD-like signal output (HDOD) protein